jgi:hypothetical protein
MQQEPPHELLRLQRHRLVARAALVAVVLPPEGHAARICRDEAAATLQHQIIAIHRAHLDSGLPSPAMNPLVKRTMQRIRRTRAMAQRRVRALVKDDVIELVIVAEKQSPLKAARGAALILIRFAWAFRRAELVSVQCGDIADFQQQRVELHIRRTKAEQEQGLTVCIPCAKSPRCPVQVLKQWLVLSSI